MGRIAHRSGAKPSLLLLGLISFSAWAMLALNSGQLMPTLLCSSAGFWTPSASTWLDVLLVLNSPASLACSAALMVAAMMLPLISGPLRHVHERSFARRRGRAMILFVAGYAMLWMGAFSGLELLALAARWAVPPSFACFIAAVVCAALWQASPCKQWFLNRCHRRPRLSAFGAAADRDAFVFGLAHGASCVGACWALMLLPLFAANLHVPVMAAVALFVAAERIERPAPLTWQCRSPSKALRIAARQLRLRSRRQAFAGVINGYRLHCQ